jgi:hypothetical protein
MRLLTVSSLNLQKADLDWRISGGWGGGVVSSTREGNSCSVPTMNLALR